MKFEDIGIAELSKLDTEEVAEYIQEMKVSRLGLKYRRLKNGY
jgi:hypothetical protein